MVIQVRVQLGLTLSHVPYISVPSPNWEQVWLISDMLDCLCLLRTSQCTVLYSSMNPNVGTDHQSATTTM